MPTRQTINDFDFENQFIKSYIQEETAIIKIMNDPFEIATNIELSNQLFDLISIADDSETIHSLLIIPDLSCCNEESYHNFIKSIFIEESTENHLPKIKDSNGQTKRAKQINLLDRFILRLIDFRKISVIALQGTIVTPFMGVSLASDFRIAASDMKFHLTHTIYGVHPTGALPYFLTKYLTPSQSKNYLLVGGKINAAIALKLHLVDKVFETTEFESKCIEYMKELNTINLQLVKSTKQFMYDKQDLVIYFEKEAQLLLT